MTVEIILIITGIVLLVASVIFTGNEKDKNQEDSSFSEEEIAKTRTVLDKMARESLEKAAEETILNTDDELCRLSNEKISSVHEFSEMNLEKIKENHDHVVFLYNMLNQKDDEIKQTLADMENAKQDMKASVNEVMRITKKLNSAVKKGTEEKPVEKKTSEKKASGAEKTSVESVNVNKLPEINSINNRNDEILNMYRQGMSIVEISKALKMGQGEVKLVIDLYGA